MEFDKHKERLNKELEAFSLLLSEILPRYIELMKRVDLTISESSELGEIEHFLIEINGKIADIKEKLDNDLFGRTIDEYYKVKTLAKQGDVLAKKRLDKLRSSFEQSLQGDTFFNWN